MLLLDFNECYFDYKGTTNLLYKPGRDMIYGDTLSRAHLKEDGKEINKEEINAEKHMIRSNTASDEKTR